MAAKKTKSIAPPGEIIRLGKDEMNLVEHPFASLWKNEVAESEIYLEWETTHPTLSKTVKASWRVTGDPKMGLPTVSDERVYLVLMELTREAGFSQTVTFTRYDLLKRLGWPDHHKYYRMLKDALTRLSSVNITAENAFWNPRAKSFSTVGFHILENYEIFSEARGRKSQGQGSVLPLSYFKWNDVMFQSFVDGNIRSIDLEFALSLERPLTLRLFRYLDKKTNSNRLSFEVSLRELCKMHLGMVVDGRYDSDLKASLKPAHNELVKRGFLESATYEAMKTRKGAKVCYVFPRRQTQNSLQSTKPERLSLENTKFQADPTSPPNSKTRSAGATTGVLPSDSSTTRFSATRFSATRFSATTKRVTDESAASKATDELLLPGVTTPSDSSEQILQQILALNVSPHTARQLVEEVPAETLLRQLECLGDREPRDRAATFVKAARENWELPGNYIERQEALKRAHDSKAYKDAQKTRKGREEALAAQQKADLQAEVERIDAIWATLDISSQQQIENEARQRLGVLGQSGRAKGALEAMRRNLLRERLK